MFWAGTCVKGRLIFKGVQGLVFTVEEEGMWVSWLGSGVENKDSLGPLRCGRV